MSLTSNDAESEHLKNYLKHNNKYDSTSGVINEKKSQF
jgi:hypothetical protein